MADDKPRSDEEMRKRLSDGPTGLRYCIDSAGLDFPSQAQGGSGAA